MDGGEAAGKGTGGVWEFSALSAQFCCEPENSLKKNSMQKINKGAIALCNHIHVNLDFYNYSHLLPL